MKRSRKKDGECNGGGPSGRGQGSGFRVQGSDEKLPAGCAVVEYFGGPLDGDYFYMARNLVRVGSFLTIVHRAATKRPHVHVYQARRPFLVGDTAVTLYYSGLQPLN